MQFKIQQEQVQAEMAPLVNLRWQTSSAQGVPASLDPMEHMHNLDKELRDLVRQDVERTMQDCEFFTSAEAKAGLSNVLYLWAKDNVEFGYRQGMNEVLAILVCAFFSETQPCPEELSSQGDLMLEEIEALTDEQLIQIIFDENHTYADIYWCFERMMGLGIKYLYQVTKDMAALKAEVRQELGLADDAPANSQKAANFEQDQLIRERLEQAYDDEKAKSVISKKCSRIYHELLKSQDAELYEHLMANQVSPELQLMRWLRCVLSREFPEEMTLQYWDFLLGGVYVQHTVHAQSRQHSKDVDPGRISQPFLEAGLDPFINLDIMCVSMIVSIRDRLLESDFSMCLAYLLSYEEPEEPSALIIKAIEIKRAVFRNQLKKPNGAEEEKEAGADDMFDFDGLDAQGADPEQGKRNPKKKANAVKTSSGDKRKEAASTERKTKDKKPRRFLGLIGSRQAMTGTAGGSGQDEVVKKGANQASARKGHGGHTGRPAEPDHKRSKSSSSGRADNDGLSANRYIGSASAVTAPAASSLVAKPPASVVHGPSEAERLREQSTLQKCQMRNACKNLMKVDEFLGDLQAKRSGRSLDQAKLNGAITDLRDALNMLNSQLR